jgi:hypothetical protein
MKYNRDNVYSLLDRHIKLMKVVITRVTTVLEENACNRTSTDRPHIEIIEKRSDIPRHSRSRQFDTASFLS